MSRYHLLIHPALLLGLVVCGCAPMQPQATIERKHYGEYEAQIGYTQVLRAGKVLYVSGVVSTAPTFLQQLEEEYRFIAKILGDYGLGTEAIVKETIYTLDMAALQRAIPIRKHYYPKGLYPSASWVQVSALYDRAILVDIEVEAHLP